MEDLPHEIASARTFRFVTKTLEEEAPRYVGRFSKTSYEDLCTDPVSEIRRIVQICGLAWSDSFEASIPRSLKNSN
jgi:hypothetical protein